METVIQNKFNRFDEDKKKKVLQAAKDDFNRTYSDLINFSEPDKLIKLDDKSIGELFSWNLRNVINQFYYLEKNN